MQETKEMMGEKSGRIVFLLAFSRPDGSRRGIPGIEPGTSRTLSENHTARPNPHLLVRWRSHGLFAINMFGLQLRSKTTYFLLYRHV